MMPIFFKCEEIRDEATQPWMRRPERGAGFCVYDRPAFFFSSVLVEIYVVF
jgi:hypothetical protein